MNRLSQNRSDAPIYGHPANLSVISFQEFQGNLAAVLGNQNQPLNSRFDTLLNQLAEVTPQARARAANQLIKQTFYLDHEKQMAVIEEAINIIDQSLEHLDPAIKESIALNLEEEIAQTTDTTYAPAANVFPLYSMLMQMAQIHGLRDFGTALALRLIARIQNAPPHHKDGEFNAGLLMIRQCPPELQRAFVIELIKLLPAASNHKIDLLERMKEEADGLGASVTIPITQKLFQVRMEQAAAEHDS